MGDVLGLVAGSGFAAGLNLYATVLLLGLFGRWVDPGVVPEVLTSTPVLLAAGSLTAVEFVADKVPWFDSVWDTVHTVVRPVGAGLLAAVLLDGGPLVEGLAEGGIGQVVGDGEIGGATGALLAALLALLSHGAKASTRVAVNTSPEPFSNSIVSVAEDGVVAAMVWLAVEHPAIALAVVAVLAVLAVLVVVGLWRTVRTARERMRRHSLRDRMRQVRR